MNLWDEARRIKQIATRQHHGYPIIAVYKDKLGSLFGGKTVQLEYESPDKINLSIRRQTYFLYRVFRKKEKLSDWI